MKQYKSSWQTKFYRRSFAHKRRRNTGKCRSKEREKVHLPIIAHLYIYSLYNSPLSITCHRNRARVFKQYKIK